MIFERYYSFFHYRLLSCRYVMLKKSILSKPKWRAQAVVRGGQGSPAPRSDGTVVRVKIFCNRTCMDHGAFFKV